MSRALFFPLLLATIAGCAEPPIDVIETDGGTGAAYEPELDDQAQPKALFTLNVLRTGTGTGTVTGTTGTNTIIACGTDCAETIILPTTVTLTAQPTTATSRFAGWSGGCTGTSTTCTATVGPGGLDVTARFDLLPRVIRYTRAGNGFGNVTATAAGATLFSCATATCSASVPHNTVVTLSATPNAFTRFGGWGGACTGTATTCTVTMSAARNVTARFIQTVRPEIVILTYDRGGRVRSTPTLVNCESTHRGVDVCTYTFDAGSNVRLTLLPSSIGRFESGPCEGDWGLEALVHCDMRLDQSQRVDVSFSGLSF